MNTMFDFAPLRRSGIGFDHLFNMLEQAERAQIVRVLDECNWVVGGPNGAAARLGLKRTSLVYRMQKLGLRRADSASGSQR